MAWLCVAEDKDLLVPAENDAWLVRFLRPCKYYPESAYEQVSQPLRGARWPGTRAAQRGDCRKRHGSNSRAAPLFQIKRYYAFKEKHSSVYKGLMPSKEKNVFEANILTVCPNRDQLGRRILVLELGSEYTIFV